MPTVDVLYRYKSTIMSAPKHQDPSAQACPSNQPTKILPPLQ
jgi:hypothetical protein